MIHGLALIFKAARALLHAMIHGLALPLALIFLLTTFPCLFFTKSDFLSPVAVFAIFPAKAWRFASLAETFFMALLRFMAFITAFFFITFIAAFFFITFMAAFFFITFMAAFFF